MPKNESKYKIKMVFFPTFPLYIQSQSVLDTPEYGRQKTIFGHFKNLISKWSGLSEKITTIVFSKCIYNHLSKQK